VDGRGAYMGVWKRCILTGECVEEELVDWCMLVSTS